MFIHWPYQYNKPLYLSIFFGTCYFFVFFINDVSDSPFDILLNMMLILPGITLPLSTCYFKTGDTEAKMGLKIIHFLVSSLIYNRVTQFMIFNIFEIPNYYNAGISGMLGSFCFLVSTKFLLMRDIRWSQILIVSIASGIAFGLPLLLQHLPQLHLKNTVIGIAFFNWIVINGFFLNQRYKNRLVDEY